MQILMRNQSLLCLVNVFYVHGRADSKVRHGTNHVMNGGNTRAPVLRAPKYAKSHWQKISLSETKHFSHLIDAQGLLPPYEYN